MAGTALRRSQTFWDGDMSGSSRRDRDLRERAREVIPGGMYGHMSTALLPPEYPQFFSRAAGARIWDADGNPYIDYMCAFGPCLFGYGHAPVEEAVRGQLALGDIMTGPSEIMVDLAEAFVSMISHAQWAMFCKNGTDATTMALVVARAATGRSVILCARGSYHGSAPWCTPRPAGVLPSDRAGVTYFEYGDAESLEAAFRAHAGDVAGVFATPFRHETFADQSLPSREYALAARRLCDEYGALLIVDDVRAGFRLARDCSWSALGVQPDLSAWGKCIANGHPISALLGSNSARAGAERVFVTGSFWFSAAPMAAALAALREIRESSYLEDLIEAGEGLRKGLGALCAAHDFGVRQTGPAQMPQVIFEDDPDFRLGYAFAAECVKRGVYVHPYHNMFLSSAHKPEDVALTLEAMDWALSAVRARRSDLQPHPGVAARLGLR